LAEPLIRKARRDDLPALADIERDADKLFLQMRDLNISSRKISTKS
jgi:hypothetical protein